MSNVTANVVVFVAAGAVGEFLSRRLGASGYRLVVAVRDSKQISALGRELDALSFTTDVADSGQSGTAIEYAEDRLGGVDGVVNRSGSMLLKPAHLTTDDEWERVIRVNLTAAFWTVRNATRAMQKRGGSIVLVSSAAARVGLVNHEAIAAAKAGVEGLMLSVASTHASRGIRVNAVAPGLVKSAMTRRLTASEDSLKVSTAMHPLGRVGEPADVASTIVWLLEPSNDWVTGQVIVVDGGLSRLRGRVRVA